MSGLGPQSTGPAVSGAPTSQQSTSLPFSGPNVAYIQSLQQPPLSSQLIGNIPTNLLPPPVTSLPASAITSGTFPGTYAFTNPPTMSGANIAAKTIATSSTDLGIFNVKDPVYGATGNGTTDDRAAIQAAITACGVSGGVVWFPSGTYKISSALSITTSSTSLLGENFRSTIIAANYSGDALTISGSLSYVTVSDLSFYPTATQTSGAAIHQSGTASEIFYYRINISAYFQGIFIESGGGAPTSIYDSNIGGCTSAGIRIGSPGNIVTGVTICNTNVSTSLSGVRLENCSGVYLNVMDILLSTGNGMLINPAAGESVRFVFCSQVQCDSGTGDGWSISTTGSGTAATIYCNQCWAAASGGHGITVAGTNVNDFSWNNGIMRANAASGMLVTAGANVSVTNSRIFQNGNASPGVYSGIDLGNVSEFIISNNFIGSGGLDQLSGATNQQAFAVNVTNAASNHYVITGNLCYNNLTGTINNSGLGAQQYVVGNIS